jgi:hypothetical protein
VGAPQVRGVDPAVMLTQGGAQAARVNEAGDLRGAVEDFLGQIRAA